MLRGSPSLLALLGLATAAGLQNRHRVNERLKSTGRDEQGSPGPWGGSGFSSGFGGASLGGAGGGFVFDLGDLLGGRPPGVVLSGGLGDLIHQFQTAGYGQTAQS